MKICRHFVICQLLKGQQNLVYFNRRGGFFTADLRLTGKAVPFLLSWRCTKGAVNDFFVNSSHHVVAAETRSLNSYHHVVAAETLSLNSCHQVVIGFWARVLRPLVVEDACFSMRIFLGVVLIRSLVCTQCVPRHLRSGSGVALN